ncbi:MAG: prephenate dehydrogenase/arogenate dehydrogenase family protein, partial [Chloroflexota bacterium]
RTRHLAVVGMGLMGGSMALALRPYAERITGIDPDPATREYAVTNGVVDRATDDLREGVREADTVVLAAPVRAIVEMLDRRLGTYLRSNTFLIDIGSTKQDICRVMAQRLPIGIQAIGGHPMTGKEHNGIGASDAGLWENRPFVLTPTTRTTPATILRALSFAQTLGAVPIQMDPARHDRIVAAISHLPYLLSAGLVATVAAEAGRDEDVWALAAGGFRDTSRLAASDIRMMSDILSTNGQSVATLLALFRVQLAQMEALLVSGEYEALATFLNPVRDARNLWQEQYEGKRS